MKTIKHIFFNILNIENDLFTKVKDLESKFGLDKKENLKNGETAKKILLESLTQYQSKLENLNSTFLKDLELGLFSAKENTKETQPTSNSSNSQKSEYIQSLAEVTSLVQNTSCYPVYQLKSLPGGFSSHRIQDNLISQRKNSINLTIPSSEMSDVLTAPKNFSRISRISSISSRRYTKQTVAMITKAFKKEKEYPKEGFSSDLKSFDSVFKQQSYFGQFLDDPTYVDNYEVIKFMEVTSKTTGIVFILGHGIFEYNIDENGRVQADIIKGAGKYWDSAYLSKKRLCYFYDEDSSFLSELKVDERTYKPVIKVKLYDGCSCRQISFSPDQSTIILNKNDRSILMFHDNNQGGFDFDSPTHIKGVFGNEIRAVKPVGNKHLVSVSANGYVSMYAYSSNYSNKLKMIKLNLLEHEEVSCVAVDTQLKFIVIATSLNLAAKRLLMISVDEAKIPNFVTARDLSEMSYSRDPLSFIQDICLKYRIDGKLVVICSQYDADNLIIPLVYHDSEFSDITLPRMYHSNLFCKFSYLDNDSGQETWSIDKNGTIKQLQLLI